MTVFSLALTLAVGAASQHTDAHVDLMVIVAHPDDEVLMSAGVIARALHDGKRVGVVLVTNGDKGCGRDGYQRQAESVAAATALGLHEDDLHFLGYPDGHLSELSDRPLLPVQRRDAKGQCVEGATTYASHGLRRLDEHTARTGAAAPYTAEALVGDLAAVIARGAPAELYLPHPIDAHPDHSATYAFVRRALDRLDAPPRLLHRAVVHADGCWPAGDCAHPYAPHLPPPPLPAPLEHYRFTESFPADAAKKLSLISLYRSQLETPAPADDWLAGFARPFETFSPERLVHTGKGWEPESSHGEKPLDLSVRPLAEGTAVFSTSPDAAGCVELDFEAGFFSLRDGIAEGETLGRWPLPKSAAPMRLRIDARPEAGGVSEWSFYGAEGFIGSAVVPTAFRSVAPSQAGGRCTFAAPPSSPRALPSPE